MRSAAIIYATFEFLGILKISPENIFYLQACILISWIPEPFSLFGLHRCNSCSYDEKAWRPEEPNGTAIALKRPNHVWIMLFFPKKQSKLAKLLVHPVFCKPENLTDFFTYLFHCEKMVLPKQNIGGIAECKWVISFFIFSYNLNHLNSGALQLMLAYSKQLILS